MAVIAFENEYLCAACDDGTHPPPPEAVSSRAFAEATVASLCNPPSANPTPEPLKENTMTIVSGRTQGTRISEEIRQSILAESPSVSHADLARKYGITDVSVGAIRRAAGIKKIKAEKPAKAPKAYKPMNMEPRGWVPEPEPQMPREVVGVTLNLSETTLYAWWNSQPISRKGSIFATHFDIRIEGTCQ